MYAGHVYKLHVQYTVITYGECDESLFFKVIIIPVRRISCDSDDTTLIQIIEARVNRCSTALVGCWSVVLLSFKNFRVLM